MILVQDDEDNDRLVNYLPLINRLAAKAGLTTPPESEIRKVVIRYFDSADVTFVLLSNKKFTFDYGIGSAKRNELDSPKSDIGRKIALNRAIMDYVHSYNDELDPRSAYFPEWGVK